MKREKTIGFFGGSFDPIHFGHLTLAIQLLKQHQLDEILFCPAFCSPFKLDRPPIASPEDRFKMIQLSIEKVPQFKVTAIEIEKGGPSYTIDTIRSLQQEGVKWRLILSEESAAHLDQWKESKELVELAPPLVGPRLILISSTQIREQLKNKLDCSHFIPRKALDYILANHLYSV